ncbi:similar to Saccharomyces cerevisiae YAL042W ERV46 Protein localized to COPII-coated vesicles, forms a complex with Erv41p [Maudiozyma barnettii]|nr:similar to Saccharomyces cerevisiae YAL042W ERV46 Protein localized to COPII-coated vesicles, forms a complex with Erv41p [Kazachstania barnettii]
MSTRRSKFLLLDVFSKTEEDVRVRTSTGGIITIGCILTTLLLLYREWAQLTEIVTRPQLYVDRDSDAKLSLNFDIMFPDVSCDILTLDIVDESGELQLDILDSGFIKTRCDQNGKELITEDYKMGTDFKPDTSKLNHGSEYCGSCYGALVQNANDAVSPEHRVCCQSCDEVHQAYLDAGWAFLDGADIDQCEEEGYVKHMNDHLNEGCRVRGSALLSRIRGNIHFAPGKSFITKDIERRGISHNHDSSLYDSHRELNFNHIIHHLSFGRPVDKSHEKLRRKDEDLSGISTNPLDGGEVKSDRTDAHLLQYSYFAKIVPTRYEYLNDKYPAVETTQFSATFHSRPIRGGRDDDHPTTVHASGGTPGVFIFYEMSALKVINREQHAQTWSGFFLNCITTIGGVLAVGTVADKIFYKAQKSIWGKKSQ